MVGWGVAQWPYLLPDSVKVSQAAAPTGTLEAVLVVFVLAAVIILPSLGLLYTLDQKSLLAGDTAREEAAPSPDDRGLHREAHAHVRIVA